MSMSEVVRILPHYTYGDYVKWEGQWELIDGIPHAMSPLPVPKHQIISANLIAEFRMGLKNCKLCKVSQPLDYVIDDDTILQPDILIVCREIQKKFLDFPPELVVEVLSPSTALKDRHTKFAIYQSQRIKYYLIISPETEEVEVYQLENDKYELSIKGHSVNYNFSFPDNCTISIDFGEIWK